MFPDSRLLRLAQKSRFWLILTISLGALSGLLVLGQARTVSLIISRVFLDGFPLAGVKTLLVYTLFFFSLRAVLSWLSSLSAKTIAVQVKSRVRNLILEKITRLGPSYLEGESSGELTSTIIEGVESLDAYFSQYLPQLALSALVPLIILFFVFPMDLLSGFVLLVTAPLIPLFMYLIGNSAKAITDRQYSTLSRLAASFLDSLGGLTTLKLFNQAQAQVDRIREDSDQYRLTTLKVLRVTFLSALVLELLATLSTAVVAVEIGLRLLYFRVTLEQALFLLIIAPEFYIPLRLLGLRFHAGMEGQSAAERIFAILDLDPPPRIQPGNQASQPLTLPFQKIELRGVSYTYPRGDGPSLQDIQLELKAGERIALVGASGAGKSTLAKLILGFFQPGEGQLLVNGSPLTEEDLPRWREQIAWVPQHPALFQDTIAANIRLARPDADDSAVAAAASAAHLADWIESLPDGYQTRIGEGGARLSGGQAQRLALARAFLKDAPLLLLDEPTSQLDPGTETRLADATVRLMEGRTVVTIAHRLNTIFQADRILVLDQGRIIQTGTHQELIRSPGTYQELVQAYTGGVSSEIESSFSGSQGAHQDLAELDSDQTRLSTQAEAEDHSSASDGTVFWRLLSFFRPFWREVALSTGLGFLTIGASIGLMGTSAWLITTAALHPSIAVLQVAIVGVRFFGITRGVSRYFERLVSHNLTFKILTRLRVWFYEHLVPLAPARLLAYRSGDLLSRIISDIKTLEDFYVRSLYPPLVAVLIGVTTGIFIAGYSPTLTALLIGFFLITGFVLPLLVRKLAQKPGQELVTARSQLAGNLAGYIQGMSDLLAFGAADRKAEQLQELDGKYNHSQLQLARISGLNAGTLIFFSNLAMWLTLILVIPLVRAGEIPGAMLGALALMVLSAFEAVQPLPQGMEILASSIRAGSRLLEIVDAQPAVIDPPDPAPFPTPIQLDIKDLSFRYPENLYPALDGISFSLQDGQILALVGPSGAGKSTLVRLLLRFWGEYEGEINLGQEAIPLERVSQQEVREQFSVLSQNAYLFHDSVHANLALGDPRADAERIIQAAKISQAHQFIQGLPEGYQTLVGERGVRFSGGERQRLNLARAVLKDGPIFLLDEPTANLDPLTEREILDTLFKILKGKTALLITHRLVNLDRVDQILVLDRGRIIERGTEAELLAQDSFYRQMWSLQNRILSYR